jgi:hypothetical protein
MNSEKKQYQPPELIVYGDIEVITLAGSQPNADLPSGNSNTAYSPGP